MSIAEQLTTIAENQQRVFDAGRNSGGGGGDYDSGYNDGYSSGYDSGYWEGYDEGYVSGSSESYDSGYSDGHSMGYDEGQTAEYDRFWDAYQQNGNRTDYQNCFSGEGWTDETFKPKYDIISTNGYMVFRRCGFQDLGATIRNSGKRVVIEHNNLQFTFQQSQQLEVIEGLELKTPLIYINGAFAYCPKLRKIQTLPIAENANTLDFTTIPLLEDISFTGVIPVSLSFEQSTKLSKASIESVINHLSTTASGKTATFSRTAVTNAFGSTTASAWTTLVNSKSNWTISLV